MMSVKNYEKEQVLFFTVSDQRFAVPFRLATEICPPHNILPLINVAPQVLGVINFKGNILPVLDILKILSPGHKARIEPGNILVAHKKGTEVGILIDGIPKIDLAAVSDKEIKYENEVYKLLDLDAILESKAAINN